MTPANKAAPLYAEPGLVRVRALEHMNIICLKRKLAGHAAEMVRSQTATPKVMEEVRKDLGEYGL
jgi:hypothetical protein